MNKLTFRYFLITLLTITLFILFNCRRPLQQYGIDDFLKVAKIDAHVHINNEHPAFIEQAQQDNFRLLTINVDYPDFQPIAEQQQIAVMLSQKYPQVVAFVSTFSMNNWDDPSWVESTIAQIDQAAKQGAVGVKVWKNIGMDFRDKNGDLVMIDHPKFDPIFNYLADKKIPVIGHQGEPKNCWLPIEEMTVKNDQHYFKNHPQYHMYLHPEMPSYEEQMAARDRMLEKNKELVFMGAHLASLEWSVDELATFLDRFPKAVVDMAARMGQVQYQSSQDREKVRQFFIKYQNRVLYATDITFEPTAHPDTFRTELHERWLLDWKYLVTSDTLKVPELDNSFIGLALPAKVIDKIYYKNARKTFSTAWRKE